MPKVHFRAQGRIARGYLAVPAEGPGPVTIVVQEWWAVDDHIRSVCDRFAAEGFMALAPDLYGEQTTNQAAEAEQRMMALSTDRARAELRGAAAYLSAHDAFNGAGVAIVGFCLGGALAVWAAATSPGVNAAVTYYDVMPHAKPDFSSIRAPSSGTSVCVTSPYRSRRHRRSKPNCGTPVCVRASSFIPAPVMPSSTTPTGWAHTTRGPANAHGKARSRSFTRSSGGDRVPLVPYKTLRFWDAGQRTKEDR